MMSLEVLLGTGPEDEETVLWYRDVFVWKTQSWHFYSLKHLPNLPCLARSQCWALSIQKGKRCGVLELHTVGMLQNPAVCQ